MESSLLSTLTKLNSNFCIWSVGAAEYAEMSRLKLFRGTENPGNLSELVERIVNCRSLDKNEIWEERVSQKSLK